MQDPISPRNSTSESIPSEILNPKSIDNPNAKGLFGQLKVLLGVAKKEDWTSSPGVQHRAGHEISSVTPVGVKELKETDIIIAVMGPTGSGKSAFILMAAGQESQNISVGHGLESCTRELAALRISFADHTDIVLVDTPSFYGSGRAHPSELEVLEIMANWFRDTSLYRLRGVLYLHRISDNTIRPTLNEFTMLKNICGEDYFGNIIIVTTMWSEVEDGQYCDAKEKELKHTHWASMIARGTTALRFTATQESAWNIIDRLITTEFNEQRALIQKELVVQKKKLAGTKAGQQLDIPLRMVVEGQANLIQRLTEELKRGDDPATQQALLSELFELQKQRKKMIKDTRQPDSSVFGTVRRIFNPILRQGLIRGELGAGDGGDDGYSTSQECPDPTQATVWRLAGKVLSKKPAYKALLDSRGSTAQTTLNILQKLLDSQGTSKDLRRSALYAMIRLCTVSGVYPQCFALQGIKYDKVPVASGGFGEIWKGHHEGHPICLKVPRIYESSDIEQLVKGFAREIIVWSQLNHPNVLPFYGLYYLKKPRGCIGLVSPWMQNGNLSQFLKLNPDVPHLPLINDILAGLVYLHDEGVVHGDLKAANVLILHDGSACLADFGLSSITDPQVLQWTSLRTVTKMGGTVRWQAPELMDEVEDKSLPRPTFSSDVYSFGSVMYEVLTGRVPFDNIRNDGVVLAQVLNGKRPFKPPSDEPLELSDTIWAVMEECWDHAPNKRPTARQVIELLSESPQPELTTHRATRQTSKNKDKNKNKVGNEMLLALALRDVTRGYPSFSKEEIDLLKKFESSV